MSPPPKSAEAVQIPIELLPARASAQPVALSADAQRIAMRRQELVNESIALVLRGGATWVEVQQGREASAREDEASARRIAELDAGTRAEVQRIEARLGSAREQTERLRLLLDYLATTRDVRPEIATAIAAAIQTLTEHPDAHGR